MPNLKRGFELSAVSAHGGEQMVLACLKISFQKSKKKRSMCIV